MKLGWATDIHLNALLPSQLPRVLATLPKMGLDALMISGDIGEAPSVGEYLTAMAESLAKPIYFVLGNHDYYKGSLAGVQESIRQLCQHNPHLHWLTDGLVVPLAPDLALIGHDGWADGRLGNYHASPVMLNDYLLIKDFQSLDKKARLQKLHELGDNAGAYTQKILQQVLPQYQQIIFLTHVPPFREACWHEGQISDDDWLPHFSCFCMGQAMVKQMRAYPQCQLEVLCGHTHSSGEAEISENIVVRTGEAEYGYPALQEIFEI